MSTFVMSKIRSKLFVFVKEKRSLDLPFLCSCLAVFAASHGLLVFESERKTICMLGQNACKVYNLSERVERKKSVNGREYRNTGPTHCQG